MLAEHRLQAAVAVAVEVEGAAVLAVPAAEGVVAKHKGEAVQFKLEIVLHAGPTYRSDGGGRIAVAADEVLGAVEAGEERRHVGRLAREIAEVPDFVFRTDGGVPALLQHPVHLRHRSEGALPDVDRAVIAKMAVAGEEGRHAVPPRGGTPRG